MQIFWLVDNQTKARLMQYQWEEHGENLEIPDEPKQQPIEIPVGTEMELEETARFMQQAPSRRRDRKSET